VWTLSSGKEALLLLVWAQHSVSLDGVIRESLDELELVLDLAALVGDLLLGTLACQSCCIVEVHHVSILTTPAGRRWHHP